MRAVLGTCLAVQWLGLCASTAVGVGSIPFRELRSSVPHSVAKKKKPPPTKPVLGLRPWEVLVLGGERPYPAQLQKPRPSLLRPLRP